MHIVNTTDYNNDDSGNCFGLSATACVWKKEHREDDD